MVVLCGAFHVEHPGAFPLLHSLPKVIHIPAEQGRTVQGFAEMVHLIAREAATPRLGAEVMVRRLTELLFIHVIRVWVEQQAASSRGWVAALRDQPISRALGLIHHSPEHGWKVEELAEAVAPFRYRFLVQSSSRTRACSRPALLSSFALLLMQGRGRWQLPGSRDDLRPRFGQQSAAWQDLSGEQGGHQSQASTHDATQPAFRWLARRPFAPTTSDMFGGQ